MSTVARLCRSARYSLLLLVFIKLCAHHVTGQCSSGGQDRQDKLALYKVILRTYWSRARFPRHYPEWRPPAQFGKLVVEPFNAKAIAEHLSKRIQDSDYETVIDILTTHKLIQRLLIAEAYASIGISLMSKLKRVLSGNVEDLMVALLTPLPAYYANELHDAPNTDMQAMVEIFCTLSNHGTGVVMELYKQLWHEEFERDLRDWTSGDFKNLIVSLAQAKREESLSVDSQLAASDARELYDAGENLLGTDESRFISILTSRSYPQLNATFNEYKKMYEYDFEEAIESEFSSDIKLGLLAIVKRSRSMLVDFLAEKLHESLEDIENKARTLTRIIVTRDENDLDDIRQAFEKRYGFSLQSMIAKKASGMYKRGLLGLLPPYEMNEMN